MPLDRVWVFGLAVLNRVYSVWYYELRDVDLDCEKSLSFPGPREVRLKEHAIERRVCFLNLNQVFLIDLLLKTPFYRSADRILLC